MLKRIQERVFPFLIALSALAISASAAFYSVTGLSKLFAGASVAVLIMAGSLEVSKLVTASLLYQYWDKINKGLRIYLTSAVVVLMVITSAGIYGFLTAAYQETAAKEGNIDRQIALLETRRDNYESQLEGYTDEKSSIDEAVVSLRDGLANNVIQYKDKETGEIITTTSSRTRRTLENQLDQAIERQSELNSRIDSLNILIFNLDTEIVEVTTSSESSSELGPLKYIAELTGSSMDSVINWLMLIIIMVFDPLAIALVIAANFAFDQLKPTKDRPKIYKFKPMNKDIDNTPEEFDEEHALDQVLNEMVNEFTEEELDDFMGMTEKTDEELDDIFEDPEVQDFLEMMDEPGPWSEEDDKIHTVGGLTNDKGSGFMDFQNKQLDNDIKRLENMLAQGKWSGYRTRKITEELEQLKKQRGGDNPDLTITY
jgi:hypothetical protein